MQLELTKNPCDDAVELRNEISESGWFLIRVGSAPVRLRLDVGVIFSKPLRFGDRFRRGDLFRLSAV
jgi:hypothetical protein